MSGSNTPQPPAPLTTAQIIEWLEYTLSGLSARRDEIVEALEATLGEHPTIEDDEVLGMVAENMRMAQALVRTSEERRKESKSPYLAGGRAVDEWFARLLGPLSRATTPLQSTMNEYGKRKLVAEREATEKARMLAEREAERRLNAAREAMDNSSPDANEQMAKAIEAVDEAQLAAGRSLATAADLTRQRGVYGAVASVRTNWEWREVDHDLVPREYLMINHMKIRETMKIRGPDGSPSIEIPGIKWVPLYTMGVR